MTPVLYEGGAVSCSHFCKMSWAEWSRSAHVLHPTLLLENPFFLIIFLLVFFSSSVPTVLPTLPTCRPPFFPFEVGLYLKQRTQKKKHLYVSSFPVFIYTHMHMHIPIYWSPLLRLHLPSKQPAHQSAQVYCCCGWYVLVVSNKACFFYKNKNITGPWL